MLCVCTVGLVLSTLILGAMVSIYHFILLRATSFLFNLRAVPYRLSKEYLAKLIQRELLVFGISILLLSGAFFLGGDQKERKLLYSNVDDGP